MDRRNFLGTILFMVAGLLIWAAHFTFLYAFNTLACTRPFAGAQIFGFSSVAFAIVVMTVLALGGASAILAATLSDRGFRRSTQDPNVTDDFLRYTTAAIAIISLIAIVWNGIPALTVPSCG